MKVIINTYLRRMKEERASTKQVGGQHYKGIVRYNLLNIFHKNKLRLLWREM